MPKNSLIDGSQIRTVWLIPIILVAVYLVSIYTNDHQISRLEVFIRDTKNTNGGFLKNTESISVVRNNTMLSSLQSETTTRTSSGSPVNQTTDTSKIPIQQQLTFNENVLKVDNSYKNLSDILVLFQYNWQPNLRVTTEFLPKWKQFFKKIVLAVPKPVPEELYSVQTNDVTILEYDNDAGFISPLTNLVKVMSQVIGENNTEQSPIKGILQLHDDLLVNLTSILSDSEWKHKLLCAGTSAENKFTLKTGPNNPEWSNWWPSFGLRAMSLAEDELPSREQNLSLKLSHTDANELLWFNIEQSDFIYLPVKSFELAFQIGDWFRRVILRSKNQFSLGSKCQKSLKIAKNPQNLKDS